MHENRIVLWNKVGTIDKVRTFVIMGYEGDGKNVNGTGCGSKADIQVFLSMEGAGACPSTNA